MPSKPFTKQGSGGVTPATLGTIRPGTPVVQLSPQEEETLNEVARTQGVDKAEVMRRVMERLPPQSPPKPSVTDQSLSKISQARELSLTSDDPNDPLNQMMRYGFYKDLRKDFKKGDEERMSTREMMEMAILQRMLPQQDNGQNSSVQQVIAEMKAENEKQRQFYENKLKEQDEKIKEMVFEKRIQTMEEKSAETESNLTSQLADISQRLELYKNIPPNTTTEQKADAVSHLENLGNDIQRIRGALSNLGIIPASTGVPAAPTAPGGDPYKKPDGSVDYFRYSIDKLENTVGKITEAWQKKTPDRKQIEETPMPEEPRQLPPRQATPEEYAEYLLGKPNLAPQEQQWLNEYHIYLQKQQTKLQSRTGAGQYRPPVQEQPAVLPSEQQVEPPAEQPAEQVYEPQEEEQPRKSVVERLKEQEAEEQRRNQGIL